MQKTYKKYYHLRSNQDGYNFTVNDTIALIPGTKTLAEAKKLADEFTCGGFTSTPGFYNLTEPIKTPAIIS